MKRAQLDKAVISFRIGTEQWIPEKRFNELLKLFDKYHGVTDEITFFTSVNHPPLPLEVVRARAELLSERMSVVRKAGYSTGINILGSIGHHNENLPHSLSGPYTPMTDLNGDTCSGSFCPNGEAMRGYVRQLYGIISSANPDYIWIDDDVRFYGHLPITETCFCDTCLGIFEQEQGQEYTRQSLRAAFGSGSVQSKLAVRKAWLVHNRNTIARLFQLIAHTVHGIRPDMPLGFMTGERFVEGYDFDTWAQILSGPEGAEVRWRPGGGFYADERMKELVGKSHEIGRQISFLPDSVVSIQSEIENFPYQRLKKAAHTTALEAASHIAAGCTGAAFNVLSMYDEPLEEYEPLIEKLCRARPFFDLLVRELGGARPLGIHTGWNKDSFAANQIDGPNWFAGEIWKIGGSHGDELFEIGLPPSYGSTESCVTVLSGDRVLALEEPEIVAALSSGVYMDAQALTHLNEMGYEELTGFRVERWVDEDCIEALVDHPLNAGSVGRRRDCRQSFWRCPAGILTPASDSAQILARVVDYAEDEVAPCCMGVFENALGGRICAAGYSPWVFLQNLSKSTQIKSVIRWLSKDQLPAYVSSFHKITLWAREPEKGRLALVAVNASLDVAEHVTLSLRTDGKEVRVFDQHGGKTKVSSSETTHPYTRFVLPAIPAWEMRLIVAG
ncbi:MAG: hypothetical protein V1800_04990 [Candidatus Latescibacterota bacterium]